MRSHARLTYTRVWQALGEKNADARSELADVLPQLEHLHQLYHVLAKARQRRGAIDFRQPRSEVPARVHRAKSCSLAPNRATTRTS